MDIRSLLLHLNEVAGGSQSAQSTEPVCLLSNVRARGRLVHLRKVSKRLMFWDFQNDGPNPDRLESICKYPDVDEEYLASLRSKIGLGDWIEVSGWVELLACKPTHEASDFSFLLHVKAAEVLEPWDSMSNGAFVPQPPAVRAPADDALSSAKPDQLCKYFLNTGRCPTPAGQCRYIHDRQPAEAWKAERSALRAERFAEIQHADTAALDAHAPSSLQKKAQRAALFVDWLVAELGADALARGTGVLDVAGGRGEVCWALRLRGIRATLLGEEESTRPRPLRAGARRYALARLPPPKRPVFAPCPRLLPAPTPRARARKRMHASARKRTQARPQPLRPGRPISLRVYPTILSPFPSSHSLFLSFQPVSLSLRPTTLSLSFQL
jgi:hypothetical protein